MVSYNLKIKKILLAMDGSEASFNASKYAIHLAKIEGAELILLHVLENIKQGGVIGLRARYGDIKIVKGYLQYSEKLAKQWMNKVEEVASSNGVHLKKEVILDQSSKAEEILQYAEKNKVDIIVIGTKGLTTFKKLIIGSVANAIVGNAKCPVLVVK
ncbi:MAG: universal stress protein [Nitrososphaerales archaeon]